MDLFKQIESFGIVPVVKIMQVEDALPLAKALCEGGLAIAEITFRTPCAKAAMKIIGEAYPDMIIGAGTVLTTKQVDDALEVGAKFMVSPGLNPKIVSYCLEKGVPIIPGCATPSDMEKAIELGLEVVKFFPAEANGGLATIKAMAAPYHQLRFMPTGGINENNLNDYLNFDKILACGGTWMVKDDLLESKQFDKIKEITQRAIHLMLGLDIAHIGLNNDTEEACEENTKKLSDFMFQPKEAHNQSNFVDKFEIMKFNGKGCLGHLGISTLDVDRAVYFLRKQGVEFDMESAKYDACRRISFIYAKEEINGFAFHLMRK